VSWRRYHVRIVDGHFPAIGRGLGCYVDFAEVGELDGVRRTSLLSRAFFGSVTFSQIASAQGRQSELDRRVSETRIVRSELLKNVNHP